MFDTSAWDAEIEDTLLRLTRDQIADHDYWFATVDIVEAGFDPSTRKPLTLSALKAWADRCRREPLHATASTPPRPPSANRHVPHTAT